MNKFAAKEYARRGFFVVLCHCIRDGACSCGRSNCESSPGKHPATPNGLLDATTDESVIDAWWDAMPDGNIGIAMKLSGLFAIDLDLYHNDSHKLSILEQNLGSLPTTVTQQSGSGAGFHVIFKHPGFDTKGTIGNIVTRSNNFIIAAPSNHISGGTYAWQENLGPGEVEVADLPDAWKAALRKPTGVGSGGIPVEEPGWLAKIPLEQRIADMWAQLAREPGEVKGVSNPGTTFNVLRGLLRGYAVCDPNVAEEIAVEYDKKCVPPWGTRIFRLADSALTKATSPTWGNAYRGADQRLEALGLLDAPVTRVAKPAPAPAPAPAPVTDFKLRTIVGDAAAGRLGDKKTVRIDTYEKELLKKITAGTYLGDDETQAVSALVKFAPAGATTDQLVALLGASVRSSDKALELIAAAQAAPEPVSMFGDLQVTPDGPDLALKAKLTHNQEGKVLDSPSNLEKIFAEDSELLGNIRLNSLTKQIEITTETFRGIPANTLAIAIMNWLDTKWRLATARSKVEDQLVYAARSNTYNPIADYLHAAKAKWDRVSRIDTWLVDYCGAEDTEFNRRVGGMWLISACARGIMPGSKVDTVLVLEGAQGSYKSSTLSTLAAPWFSDSPLIIGNKDSQQMANYRWVIELAELASLKTSDTEAIKAFLSQKVDNFRPPYGKVPEEFPRFAVFGATTNDDRYLPDSTGNRRFWPVAIVKCDIQRLKRDRDQLWAEAAFRYLSADMNLDLVHPECPGERWWFETEAEHRMAAIVVAQRKPYNSWSGQISQWVGRCSVMGAGGRRQWTLVELAKLALEIEIEKIPQQQKAITEALRESGLVRVMVGGVELWRLPDGHTPGGLGDALRAN